MTFQNSILAGTTLVREAISSEGFVAGSSGWSIERDGDAEFNDVTVRGTVSISDSGGTMDLNVDILGQPRIEFTTPNNDQYQITADNVSMDIGALDNFAGDSSIHIVDGEGIVFRAAGGGQSVYFDYDTGYLFTGIYSPWAPETWVNVGLVNGWNYTGVTAFDEVGYKRSPDGRLWFRGATVAGTKTDGTRLFTLPVGRRPAQRKQLAISTDTNGITAKVQVMEIGHANAGEVQVYHMGAAGALVFDGLSFELV